MKRIISLMITTSLLAPSIVMADGHSSRFEGRFDGASINSNHNNIIVNPKYNRVDSVVVNPKYHRDNNIIVAPRNHGHNNVVAVPKHHNKTVIIKPVPVNKVIVKHPNYARWHAPVYPGWVGWRGGRVVVVEDDHDFIDYFNLFINVTNTLILIDEKTKEPYTETGKKVTVKKINCDSNDETEFYELDDEILILACS